MGDEGLYATLGFNRRDVGVEDSFIGTEKSAGSSTVFLYRLSELNKWVGDWEDAERAAGVALCRDDFEIEMCDDRMGID